MINRQQILDLAYFMRRLEEDHTVTIKFTILDSIYGMVYMGKNSKYLMIVNSCISYEKQLETIWHEANHIYSHLGIPGNVKVFERESIEISEYAVEISDEVLPLCRTAW